MLFCFWRPEFSTHLELSELDRCQLAHDPDFDLQYWYSPKMKSCILCQKQPPDPKKPEHILLNALGGKKTSKISLCSDCNNVFGAGPDKELAESVLVLRNIANLPSGKNRPPPTIRRVEASGVTYDLGPGGLPVLRPECRLHDDGEVVSISARDEEHLDQLLAALMVKRDVPEEKQEALADHFKKQVTRTIGCAPAAPHSLSLGSELTQRSMMKACLVLWAECIGNHELKNARYDDARNFALTGEVPPTQNSAPFTQADGRPVAGFEDRFGINPNLIWVGSDAEGRVLGYYRLYNAVGWSFELAVDGAPPNRERSLISNPFTPSQNETGEMKQACIDFQWVRHALNGDFKETYKKAQHAIGELLRQAYEASHEKELENLLSEALEASGLKEGDTPDKATIERFSKQVAIRLTHFKQRRSRTEPLLNPSKLLRE